MTDADGTLSPSLCNIEAEAALLGALMIDNHQIDATADRLTGAAFAEPLHGRIFEAITRESSLGRAVNPVTLRPYFEGDEAMQALGGLAYLARLTTDGHGLFSIRTMIDQIAELARRRILRAGLIDSAAACTDLAQPLADIIAGADAALVLPDADREARDMLAVEALAAMRETSTANTPGVICGSIPPADALLGPLRPGQLVVIAARPGMGKTAFAVSYAAGVALQGHGVLFVSLEMPAEDLAERLAGDLA